MKYLIFTNIKSGQKLPVFFPENVTHSEVKLEGCVPVSGGFVNMQTFEACGSSQSLGLKPDFEADSNLIQLLLGGRFETMWALYQDADENKKQLENFCASCFHLMAAHRFGADEVCRCAVSGCSCASLNMPKKIEQKC